MLFDQRKRLVGQRRRHVGVQRERAIEARVRLIEAVEPQMDDANIVVCFGVAGVELQRPPVIDQGLVEPHRARVAQSAHLVEGRAIWLDLVALTEIGHRLVIAFQIEQQLRAGVRSLQMARIELQGMLKTQHGLVGTLQLDEHVAHALPQLGVLGLEHHAAIVGLQGLLQPSRLLQCIAETQEVFGFRGLPDGAGDPLDGVIVLLLVKGDNAHQMQRVGMVRLLSQGLPGTAFGFGDLPRFQKVETELAERSRRGRTRAGGDLRGFSDSPALVTVHQPPNSE